MKPNNEDDTCNSSNGICRVNGAYRLSSPDPGQCAKRKLKSHARILDIDIDVLVDPPVFNKAKNDPRPADKDHSIPSFEDACKIVRESWHIGSETPIWCLERHDEIISAFDTLVRAGAIEPPVCWIHVDAHDDFWGHYSKPTNEANFMYEVVRRGWCDLIGWVHPKGHGRFPSYIYDEKNQQVSFDGFLVPIRFFELEDFRCQEAPDYCFLTRSPQFAPPKIDRVYDAIAALGAKTSAEQVIAYQEAAQLHNRSNHHD